MTSCDYGALREATSRLFRLGLSVQTVIPLTQPAEIYPQAQLKSKTCERDIQRDTTGQPLPAFVGKSPSFWLPNGQPILTSHSKAIHQEEILERLQVSEQLGRPIGIAVIPSTDVVVIDFDHKNYPSQEALDQDWMRLLDLCPQLTETRIERTPGGGVHIYLRPADGMDSWRTSAGKLHCNFSTAPAGEHRGEVLSGTRVCVCAPTRIGSSAYALVNPEYAYHLVEVRTLEAIGIHPRAKASSRTEHRQKQGRSSRNQQPHSEGLPALSGSTHRGEQVMRGNGTTRHPTPHNHNVFPRSVGRLNASGRGNPCPCCGRDVNGSCRWTDGWIACFYGDRFAPPAGLQVGDVHRIDGRPWAVVSLYGGHSGNSMVLRPHREQTPLPAPSRGHRNLVRDREAAIRERFRVVRRRVHAALGVVDFERSTLGEFQGDCDLICHALEAAEDLLGAVRRVRHESPSLAPMAAPLARWCRDLAYQAKDAVTFDRVHLGTPRADLIANLQQEEA